MRLSIIGGSRGTGARLAVLAQKAGHHVRVVSRSGAVPPGAEPMVGDATDPDVAAAAVAGIDVVVICVGGAKGTRDQRTRVTRSIVAAMQQAGVKRLIVQSSLGAGDSARQLPAVTRAVMLLALAAPLADHNTQEQAVTASGLDWTIVRPTGLTNRPGSGRWLALEPSQPGTLRGTVPRDDLAALMLQLLEDDSSIGKALGVSS